MTISKPATEVVTRAANILNSGGLIAFPTETVYGLGADASNPDAVAKIFAAKGRPADHPLIVHVGSAAQLGDWATGIPPEAYDLANKFWPGPLTLILQRSDTVPDAVTGGQDTVGLRVPNHPTALSLLKAFGGGIAAPSANRFGRISPTTAQHVRDELGNAVDVILDGGACEVGLESTILDLSGDRARVLRPGGIAVSALAEVLGYTPELVTTSEVRASGTLASHYAPTTPAALVTWGEIAELSAPDIGVLSLKPKPKDFRGSWLTLPPEAAAYGAGLYGALRTLDTPSARRIYIETVPDEAAWTAVRDRLQRATHATTAD